MKEILMTYFLAIMLILNVQSVYQDSAVTSFHIYELTLLAILCQTSVALCKYGIKSNKQKNWFYFTLFFYIYLAIQMFVNVDSSQLLSFSARYAALPFVFLYFKSSTPYLKKTEVFKAYVNVMVCITSVSLLFWLFGSTLNLIKPTGTYLFEWGCLHQVNSYYGIYFETQGIDWLPIDDICRNTAIFVEGPMFNLVLCFALCLYYYFNEIWQLPKWKGYILILGIASTFSVLGYFVVFVLYGYNIIKESKSKYLIVMSLVPLIIYATYVLLQMKMTTGSYALREDDFSVGIKTWLISPIFGLGFNNFEALMSNMDKGRDQLGFSNSIFSVLTQGGVYMAFMFIIPVTKGLLSKEKKRMVLSCVYVFLFCNTIFQTAYINFFLFAVLIPSILKNPDKYKQVMFNRETSTQLQTHLQN